MEYPLSILSEDSDVSIDSEELKGIKSDPFLSRIPTWSNRYRCLQAYVCYVLSFMSTLKFCLTVGRYGVVIFLPYWLFNIFYGVGSVLVEIQMGRFVIGNVARAWEMCPIARGILWCLFGTTFFSVIIDYVSNTYLLKYFIWSFRTALPWKDCDSSWASETCYVLGKKMSAFLRCKSQHSEDYCGNITWQTSGMQFWNSRVRGTDSGTSVLWSVFNLIFSAVISFLLNYKGIRSLEKFFPFFLYPTLGLWLVLSCVTFLVPNSMKGLRSLWHFDWYHLTKMELWMDSFRDIIHYLGLGKLTLSFISSHGRFDDNILVDTLIASVGSLFVGILVTTPILSIIINIREHEGLTEQEDLFDNFDDIFVYISEAIVLYPRPRTLWSVLTYLNWFLMSTSAQALTVLSLVEAVQGQFKEQPNLYFRTSLSMAAITVTIGLLFIFFPILVEINIGSSVALILLLNTFTWQQCYGIWKFNKDHYFMMGRPLPIFIKGSWISVVALPSTVILLSVLYGWPNKPLNGIAYIYVAVPLAVYLSSMCLQMFKRSESRTIFEVFKANPDWGPSNPILRKSRIVFDSSTASKEMLYRQELCHRPFIRPPDITEQNIVQIILPKNLKMYPNVPRCIQVIPKLESHTSFIINHLMVLVN